MNSDVIEHAELPPSLGEVLSTRFGSAGPRYTSYPTADRFTPAFGLADLETAQERRRSAGSTGRPISLYVHIPFCESLCYYCACNKVITRHHERAAEYLDALEAEMALHAAALGERPPVSQLHFGGGSPTFLTDAELARLMASLAMHFDLRDDAEVSVEVDPRTVDADRLARLRAIGFNRISFGVQDFNPDVQKAVHRVQPYESVRDLIAAARACGFESINTDLIYGLPLQTPETFAETVQQIAGLAPDRISMYAYAHLPQRFKSQRRIHGADLPGGSQRLGMLSGAIASFLAHGYTYIGMDHFARPGDALAQAKREGRLHRNFQGYSTQPECDLVGLGVSAIGTLGDSFYQNAKTLPAYYEAVRAGRLPVERGIGLTADDRLRREVIMGIMCQGEIDFASIERRHGITMRTYFADELDDLSPFVEAGLARLTPSGIELTPSGWYVVRGIAMVFDRYIRQDHARDGFSRIV